MNVHRVPVNCQQEPPFPGLATVLVGLRAPDITSHGPTDRCEIEAPHLVAVCGEWAAEQRQRWPSHGGPTIEGRHALGNGGYRRLAAPAP